MSKVTNYEYFNDEIKQLIEEDPTRHIAVTKEGKPCLCNGLDCNDCGLSYRLSGSSMTCSNNLVLWLYAEHIEKPKLTKKERQFCELVETGWITRTYMGNLDYRPDDNRPNKNIKLRIWEGDLSRGTVSRNIDVTLPVDFSFITWDDKEPWSVEELLKLEVCDG